MGGKSEKVDSRVDLFDTNVKSNCIRVILQLETITSGVTEPRKGRVD